MRLAGIYRRFRLMAVLGRGGYGKVLQVMSESNGNVCNEGDYTGQ